MASGRALSGLLLRALAQTVFDAGAAAPHPRSVGVFGFLVFERHSMKDAFDVTGGLLASGLFCEFREQAGLRHECRPVRSPWNQTTGHWMSAGPECTMHRDSGKRISSGGRPAFQGWPSEYRTEHARSLRAHGADDRKFPSLRCFRSRRRSHSRTRALRSLTDLAAITSTTKTATF